MRVEVRLAARRLWQTPIFTLAVVVLLTLGIGGATFLVSIVQTLLFEPIPYRSPESLVVLSPTTPHWELFEALQERVDVFECIAASVERAANLSELGSSERVLVLAVTPQFLQLTGMSPLMGRALTEHDFTPNAKVAVITYRTWRERYGGMRDIVGQALWIDGLHHTIVGVLPAAFKTVEQMKRVHDLPFGRDIGAVLPLVPRAYDPSSTDTVQRDLVTIARLRIGSSVTTANHQVAPILAREERAIAGSVPPTFRLSFVPLESLVVQDLPNQLTALSLAVATLLLAGCGNVMNLLLTRLAARRRDIAVSLAVGASAWRVAGDLVTEIMLITTAGGFFGILLASRAIAMTRGAAGDVLDLGGLQMDLPVLGFGIVLSLSTGLLLGVLTAIRQARTHPLEALQKQTDAPNRRGALPFSSLLVIGQVALAVLIVTAGAALARGFIGSMAVRGSVDSDAVLTAEISLDRVRYWRRGATNFFSELLDRSATLPGVEAAALVGTVPAGQFEGGAVIAVDGERAAVDANWVSANYFKVLSIPIVAGTTFVDRRQRDLHPELVVNETFARRYWPTAADALGHRIAWGTVSVTSREGSSVTPLEHTIVGVVADSRDGALATAPKPKMYSGYANVSPPLSQMTVLLRASGVSPSALAEPLAAIVHDLDHDQPLYNVLPMRDIIRSRVARERLLATSMNVFAFLTLVIAAIGVYSSMAVTGSRRRAEIGVRLALGATRRAVLLTLVRRSGKLIIYGIELGVLLAVIVASFLRTTLFPSEGLDVATTALAVVVVGIIAGVAVIVPAWRATGVDPAVTLRAE